MVIVKKYEVDLSKLCSSVQSSRMVLRHGRAQHMEAARLYAGDQWSEESAREKTFVNFIALYVDIVLRKLISKNPRLMLSTFEREHKPVCYAMQTWANDEYDKMDFANVVKKIGLNAMFSGGWAKVSLATPAEAARGAWHAGPGAPCIQHIDRDDMVWDTHARDWDEVDFVGHRYRAPLQVVKDSIIYEKSRKDLAGSTDERFNKEGDERINVLGRGYYGNDEEYEEKVDLWEVYCPRERMVYTLAEDCLTGAMAPAHKGEPKALREQEWIGSDRGPFAMLALGSVPGNLSPKGPVMNIVNLHRSANRIMRKLMWSAENFKEILMAPKGADGDIERIRQSMHGDILPMDRPKDFAAVPMNAPNPMLFQFFMQIKELISWCAGNLDIMGGLSPQAKTARQSAMLDQNATEGIADMQDRMLAFVSDVSRRFLWYPWHDPNLVMKSNYSPQGLPDVQIPQRLYPWNHPDPRALKRTASFEDLHIKIDPYSMPTSTPQQRAGDLVKVVKEVWAPMAQLAAQQGVVLDFNAFLEKLGVYLDMPDLKEIITMQEPPPESGPGGASVGGAPAPEETTHVRENVPMRTPQNNALLQMNHLQGIDSGGAPKNGQVLQPG